MKRQILGITIATVAVCLTAIPKLRHWVKKPALLKFEMIEYQAVKLENSMDAMLNPEQGGVRPMPPPPPWIPPVEEGLNNTLPPSNLPKKPNYRNYTPMRHLPPSAPWIEKEVENEGEVINTPDFPIR